MSAFPSYPLFDPSDPVFRAHEGGKLGVHATQPLRDRADLALLYTPGVADVSRAIAARPLARRPLHGSGQHGRRHHRRHGRPRAG